MEPGSAKCGQTPSIHCTASLDVVTPFLENSADCASKIVAVQIVTAFTPLSASGDDDDKSPHINQETKAHEGRGTHFSHTEDRKIPSSSVPASGRQSRSGQIAPVGVWVGHGGPEATPQEPPSKGRVGFEG